MAGVEGIGGDGGVKFADIFDLQMGKTPSRSEASYWNGRHKWCSIADIGAADKYIRFTKEQITDLAIAGSGIKPVPAGTVIMSFKLSIGKTAITTEPIYTNEAIMAFMSKGVVDIDTDYLYHYLTSKNWEDGINKAVMGKTLNKATISEMDMVVPSMEKQKKVADHLDRVDAVISKRNQQLQKLDELVKARFVEMFGDPVANNMNWGKQRFDSLCENLDGKRRPITSTDRVYGPYPYYGASGIVDHVADYIFDEDILLISEDGANLLARSTPIAFSVTGKVWVNNHAHVLRFPDFALQKYIEYFFAMISIEDYITGSTQPKLNQAKLNAMMIPVPPRGRMNDFLSFIEQVDKSKAVIQSSLDQLETLKQSLMQRYFG